MRLKTHTVVQLLWRMFRALRVLRVFRVQVLPKKRCTSVLAPMSVVSSYWGSTRGQFILFMWESKQSGVHASWGGRKTDVPCLTAESVMMRGVSTLHPL